MNFENLKYVTKITPDSSEAAHQARFFEWCALMQCQHPVLATPLIFSVRNEDHTPGKTGMIRRAQFKRTGVKSGVADVIFLFPSKNGEYDTLCIEFKKPNKGSQSNNQRLFEDSLTKHNPRVNYIVCYGWKEGCQAVINHLS